MPQLDPKLAQTVADTESSAQIMEEGFQETVLLEVKGDGNGPAGPYWTWVFKNPDDSLRYKGWQHWVITSLSPDAAWKMKETFEAFGVSPATNTDDLIGMRVRVEVGTYTVQKGPNAGELKNNVKKVLPLEGTATTAGATTGAKASTTTKNF